MELQVEKKKAVLLSFHPTKRVLWIFLSYVTRGVGVCIGAKVARASENSPKSATEPSGTLSHTAVLTTTNYLYNPPAVATSGISYYPQFRRLAECKYALPDPASTCT